MKIIKALLLLTVIIGVSSCTKDTDNPTRIYSVTAKVDGAPTNFNTNVTGTSGSANGTLFTTIQGKTADGSSISITIRGEVVAGKTYSAATVGASVQPLVVYTSGTDSYVNTTTGANLVSVTVTEATKTFVEGTFTGDLTTVAIGGTAKTKVITNGIFTSAIKK
jgi:hypothetical protein